MSATPAAARLRLQAVAADLAARGRVGFKPAGGIRTVANAALHIGLVREILGDRPVTPTPFRIGTSGTFDDVEAVLGCDPRTSAGSSAHWSVKGGLVDRTPQRQPEPQPINLPG